MKVKLLYLPKESVSCLPPLGIATLTSFLRKNDIKVWQDDLAIKVFAKNSQTKNENDRINIEIFANEDRIRNFVNGKKDIELEEEGYKLLKLSKFKNYDIVGFSLSEGAYGIATAAVLAKLLKEKYDIKIVAGGYGGGFPEESKYYLLRNKLVDAFFFPPYPLHLLFFCKGLEKNINYKNIPGIIYLSKEKIKENRFTVNKVKKKYKKFFERPKNFSHFIRPDFDGLPLKLYKPRISFEYNGDKINYRMLILPYLFIQGCPHKCAFCGFSLTGYEARDPTQVAEELKFLSKKYRTKYFFFINCAINPTYQYAEKIANEFKKLDLNIHWSDCANFQTMDKKLLEKLKEVGCVRLVFGLECASPRILKLIKKPVTLPQVEKVLKTAYKIGIWSEINIICGFPYERKDDVEFTINFLLKNKKYVQNISLTRFFLDGLMKTYPKRYGLRIRKFTNLIKEGNMTPFDEINGLRWEEKLKQIEDHYKIYSEKLCKPLQMKKHQLQNFSKEDLCYVHFVSWWKKMKNISFKNLKEESMEINF